MSVCLPVTFSNTFAMEDVSVGNFVISSKKGSRGILPRIPQNSHRVALHINIKDVLPIATSSKETSTFNA